MGIQMQVCQLESMWFPYKHCLCWGRENREVALQADCEGGQTSLRRTEREGHSKLPRMTISYGSAYYIFICMVCQGKFLKSLHSTPLGLVTSNSICKLGGTGILFFTVSPSFLFFFSVLATLWYVYFLAQGSEQQLWSMPQLQKWSLAHCARPGIEPESQRARDATDPVASLFFFLICLTL